MKTFTLEEASSLLPILDSLLKRAVNAKEKVELRQLEIAALSHRIMLQGGVLVRISEAARRRAEHDHALKEARDAVAEIDSIGVQVKDLDTGLLDFPFQLGDDVVLLCWKLGESEIGWWHRIEDGFRGRQPLDARFIGKAMGHQDDSELPN
jgi:hypothetical protein